MEQSTGCLICGGPKPPSKYRPRLYCDSPDCVRESRRRQNGKRRGSDPMAPWLCIVCSAEMPRRAGRPPKGCSPACVQENQRRKSAAWYEEHAGDAAFVSQSKEYKAAQWKAYYDTNRDAMIARSLEYARTHPEWKRAKDMERYAKTRGAVGSERFTLAEIYLRDEGLCGLCAQPVEGSEATVDHIVPVSLGGSHTRDNAQLAHRSCNSSKGNRVSA